MGYDLIVWNTKERLSNNDANMLFGLICDHEFSQLEPTTRIDAFYRELTVKYPEVDGHNDSPWTGPIEKSSAYVRIECVWSRSDEVDFAIRSLAAKHDLAIFDPQQIQITYPEQWTPSQWQAVEAPESWKQGDVFQQPKPWWKFWK